MKIGLLFISPSCHTDYEIVVFAANRLHTSSTTRWSVTHRVIIKIDDFTAELGRRTHLHGHLRGPRVVKVRLLVVENPAGSEGVVERDHVVAALHRHVAVGHRQA